MQPDINTVVFFLFIPLEINISAFLFSAKLLKEYLWSWNKIYYD